MLRNGRLKKDRLVNAVCCLTKPHCSAKQALRKRKQLYHDPSVRQALSRFWDTYSKGDSHTVRTQDDRAQRVAMQSEWSTAERENFAQTIQMHEYIDVHMKMAKALRK